MPPSVRAHRGVSTPASQFAVIIWFMSDAMPHDLVERWYEYWRRSSGARSERKAIELGEPADVMAAHDWVSDKIAEGGLVAVEVLTALAEGARDDGSIVGIGPTEDLLYVHGDEIVDLLVEQAKREPALARALVHVSLADGSVSAASLAKIKSVNRLP